MPIATRQPEATDQAMHLAGVERLGGPRPVGPPRLHPLTSSGRVDPSFPLQRRRPPGRWRWTPFPAPSTPRPGPPTRPLGRTVVRPRDRARPGAPGPAPQPQGVGRLVRSRGLPRYVRPERARRSRRRPRGLCPSLARTRRRRGGPKLASAAGRRPRLTRTASALEVAAGSRSGHGRAVRSRVTRPHARPCVIGVLGALDIGSPTRRSGLPSRAVALARLRDLLPATAAGVHGPRSVRPTASPICRG